MRFGPVRTSRRRSTSTLALVALVGATVLAGTATSASADPIDDRIQAAAAQLDTVNARVGVAVEAYDQAVISQATAERKVAATATQVAAAQGTVTELQAQLGRIAAAAYRTGGTSDVITLALTSDSTDFLSKAGLLDQLSRNQASTLHAVQAAKHQLAQQEEAAQRTVAAQSAITATLAAKKSAIESDLTAADTLVASLQGEKVRLDGIRAEQAAAAAKVAQDAARAEAARAAATPVSRSVRTVTAAAAAPAAADTPLPASGRAGTAVSWARQKLGSPYEWAASGPDRFDCSGLTMFVWGKAGVGLPHSAQAQFDGGRHVNRADLQPGDLVFFGSPIHHVGVYIGGGDMIAAPHSGDVVKIQAIDRQDYVGAVRPG